MQFIDVRTDFAFKKVFGSEESKDILISFLNAILDFGENPIVDLTILNPYQIPLVKGLKETYVDIKARLENGIQVIIEMQASNQPGFGKRIPSNLAKAYSTQLRPGNKYTEHNPVIALTVTDFVMFKHKKLESSVNTRFQFLEIQEFIPYPDNEMEMVFVELPKFDKKVSELTSISDKWIYFIKQAGHLTAIPQALASEVAINHALEIANTACLTQEELEFQENKIRWLMDQKNAEAKVQAAEAKAQTAEAKAQAAETKAQAAEAKTQAAEAKAQAAEAKAQATEAEKQAALEKAEQAEKAAKLQIAKQMLQAHAEIAFIMQVTGLEEVEIENL